MKRETIALAVMALLALATSGHAQDRVDVPCDRASNIRSHVAASDKMPADVKEYLLKKADELCPFAEVAGLIKKGDELFAQGKIAEALGQFELALAARDKLACRRCFELARKLEASGKIIEATQFFEASLSVCPDEKTYQEYRTLRQKAGSARERKADNQTGPALIKKEVIIESLLARPSKEAGTRKDIGVQQHHRHPSDWYDSDRWDRVREDRDWSGRTERYHRFSRYASRDERYRWYDDEDTGVQSFPIQFQSGSALLTHQGKAQLDELAHAMTSRELKHVRRFFIDGHTDSIGTPEANCDLGMRRAESVIRYLVERWSVHPLRLAPRSFGEDRPISPNYDEQGRFDNRRVEVRNADMAREHSGYARGKCR